MIEQSANELNQIMEQLNDIKEEAGVTGQKMNNLDAGNKNLLEKIIGVEADLNDKLNKQAEMDDNLMNRINDIQHNNNESQTTLQAQLNNLDADNKNNTQNLVSLQEAINIQSEEVKKVDAERQMAGNKIKDDIDSYLASNAKAISELKNDVAERIKPTEDKLANVDKAIDSINNTIVIFEDRHNDTVERIKEATVITNNIQMQIQAQEQKMIEQSTNDLNKIKEQLQDLENLSGVSGQKIKDLDAGNQNLLDKMLGMENEVASRLDDLANSDASILAKINGLESNNDQTILALTSDLEKKVIDTENRLQNSTKSDIQSLSEHLAEQIRTNNSTTERRLAEADTGNQQLLEKLLQVEKDVEGKLVDNASSLQNQLSNLDTDNKNNTQLIVSLQESMNIQAEEVRKVDADRQLAASKAKDDLDATVAANAKAIAELKSDVDDSIHQRIKPTEDKLKETDGAIQVLNQTVAIFESRHVETVEKLKEVTVITNGIQTQIKEQEQKMVEQSASDLHLIKEQMSNIENQVGISGQKINELDIGNQNLQDKIHSIDTGLNDKLKKQEEMDDSLLNKINDLQIINNQNYSSLEIKLGDLDADNKNNMQNLVNLQESINLQSEEVKKVDAERQMAANKAKEDIESTAASNAKAMADLKNDVAQSIAERIQPAEEKLASLDNNVSGLNKTIAIFEDRHVETVEKIKEQEQKMVNQSTNDMNQIKEKLEDIENHAGLSDQKIKELDSGNQNLLNKILGMENEVANRLDDLAKTDAS